MFSPSRLVYNAPGLAQGLLAYYSLCRIQEADYAWVTLAFLIISAFCACFLTRDKTFHISVSITFTTSFALDSMYFYGVIGKCMSFFAIAQRIYSLTTVVKCDPPPTLEERRIVDPSSEATHRQSHLRDSGFPSRWPANRACPTRTHHSQLLVLGVPRILDVWPTRKRHIQFPVFNITSSTSIASQASPVNTAFFTPPPTL